MESVRLTTNNNLMKTTYKSMLKRMTKEELAEWVSKQTDHMLAVGSGAGSTPILTKIIYAKSLLKS